MSKKNPSQKTQDLVRVLIEVELLLEKTAIGWKRLDSLGHHVFEEQTNEFDFADF